MKYKIEVLDNGFVLTHMVGCYREACLSKDDVINKILHEARVALDVLETARTKKVEFSFDVKVNPIETRAE